MKKIISISVVGIILITLLAATATHSFVSYTSTTEFCIGCHEMRSTVYEEFQQTAHAKNRIGVVPSCADCHIPRVWYSTLYRKVIAVKDVYHHLLGTIDTPEKFEARRLIMAKRVWATMKENDSRECRNCHEFSSMALDKQKRRARKQHENAVQDGETCIDCHKGIAHKAVHEDLEEDIDDEMEIKF